MRRRRETDSKGVAAEAVVEHFGAAVALRASWNECELAEPLSARHANVQHASLLPVAEVADEKGERTLNRLALDLVIGN